MKFASGNVTRVMASIPSAIDAVPMRVFIAAGTTLVLACGAPEPCEVVTRVPGALTFSGQGTMVAVGDDGVARVGCSGMTLYDLALEERGHVDLGGAWIHSVAVNPDGSGHAFRDDELVRFDATGEISLVARVAIPAPQSPTQTISLSVENGSAGPYLSGPAHIVVDGVPFQQYPTVALDLAGAVRFSWPGDYSASRSVFGGLVQDGTGNDIVLRRDMGAPAMHSVDATGTSRWTVPMSGFDIRAMTADPTGGVITVIELEDEQLELPGRTLVASPYHLFVVAFDREGTVRWATMLDDWIEDFVRLSATSTGDAMVTGRYSGVALGLPDSFRIDLHPDPFVARVGPSGVVTARELPSRGYVFPTAIAPAAGDDVWLSLHFLDAPENAARTTIGDTVIDHDGDAIVRVSP